jgi:uncharacterized protein YajQ (UPF0234 family)
VLDVLQSKMVQLGLSLKILKMGKLEQASGGTVGQTIELQEAVSQDLAREITKLICDRFPKVSSQIQGDAVRVTAKSKDDLQAVIAALREKDYAVPLQFNN